MIEFHHPNGNTYVLHDALHVGVVLDSTTRLAKRVMNPDYEEELDWHFVAADEVMVRLTKTQYNLAAGQNIDLNGPGIDTLQQIISDAQNSS